MRQELEQAKNFLSENGIISANAEAEIILCHLMNCSQLDLHLTDAHLTSTQKEKMHAVLHNRVNGMPLQYLLGETCFFGHKFFIEQEVFIPRPETELLVDVLINKFSALSSKLSANILDLCTGSGNIAISLTKALKCYKIAASDISEKAVKLAIKNAKLNNVYTNIKFKVGDLFTPWFEYKGFFDMIVCNPPYIKSADLMNLPEDVKNEPSLALDGGHDGLDFYKKIIQQAPEYLKQNGLIFFEIGPDISEGVKALLATNFYNIEILKDYNELNRIAIAQKR